MAIRIQILTPKEEADATAQAVAIARRNHSQLTEVARQHRAEALLVCPAPEGFVEDGFNLAVAMRFEEELDEETAVFRQTDLAIAINRALGVRTVSLDLDNLGGFLRYIAPLLAAPYRDEIGPRRSPAYPEA
jgi:hypothetical protein